MAVTKRALALLLWPLLAQNSPALAGNDPSGFVRLESGAFWHGDKRLQPWGSSCYPYWEHGSKILHGGAWADPDFPEYIHFILDLAQKAGLNTLRVTDILDGAKGDWREPVIWSNLDVFIQEARQRGLYVILTASVFRKWLIKRDRNPYDPALWGDFLDFFGNRYKDAPNILYIGIAGEVPPPNSKDKDGSGKKIWKSDAAGYLAFFRHTLARLRQADPNHLLCVGGLSFLNKESYSIPWQGLFSLPENSLAAIHVYSEGDLQISLPLVSAWAAEKKMPWLLEEFGAKQELGDEARAAYFDKVLNQAKSHGAAGVGFWNLGPELAPSSYEVGPQSPRTFESLRKNQDR